MAQQLIIGGHFTFALENPDRHGGLAVFGGRESLALLGRDRGVAFDQFREDAAQGFNTKGQRRDIQQQDILDIALQNAGLNSGAQRYHFIRVDALVRLAAKECFDGFHNLGHPGHAADQHDFVNFAGAHGRILQRGLQGGQGALDQIIHEGFQFGPGQFHGQMLRPTLIGGDEGQIDLRLNSGRQFYLGLFRRLF